MKELKEDQEEDLTRAATPQVHLGVAEVDVQEEEDLIPDHIRGHVHTVQTVDGIETLKEGGHRHHVRDPLLQGEAEVDVAADRTVQLVASTTKAVVVAAVAREDSLITKSQILLFQGRSELINF